MMVLRRIISGLRRLFHRTQVEQELDEELRGYLETAIEQKMLAGLRRAAAVRAARVELGSPEAVKDRARDVGWESLLETVWRGLGFAVRMLRRSPGFSAVAILTLAQGIGVNTAMFSVINTILLGQPSYADAGRLVALGQTLPRVGE